MGEPLLARKNTLTEKAAKFDTIRSLIADYYMTLLDDNVRGEINEGPADDLVATIDEIIGDDDILANSALYAPKTIEIVEPEPDRPLRVFPSDLGTVSYPRTKSVDVIE
jgi:hypothetical protein